MTLTLKLYALSCFNHKYKLRESVRSTDNLAQSKFFSQQRAVVPPLAKALIRQTAELAQMFGKAITDIWCMEEGVRIDVARSRPKGIIWVVSMYRIYVFGASTIFD